VVDEKVPEATAYFDFYRSVVAFSKVMPVLNSVASRALATCIYC